MQHKTRVCFNATLLASNPEKLNKFLTMMAELEEKGYLKDGDIIFDDVQSEEVNGILDKLL
ncbi:MAG: hypothetical protein HDS35_07730 [Bacteroides sp.]|nr:hypothetical protein [Bacteroides sp.]